MSIEVQSRNEESKEGFTYYDAIVVSPGFDNPKHGTGLHWDTRLREFAAAAYYREGLTDVIVVGGAKLGTMKDSFANLMERALKKKYKIPENDIILDVDTFDTASQLEWVRVNKALLGENIAIMTDSQQKKHFSALLNSYGLQDLDILACEDVVVAFADRNEHVSRFIKKLHRSPYWKYWQFREAVLTLFTQYFDKEGKWLGKFTIRRLYKD